MNRQRSDEWAARVVAWHNRHPLARRILPEQVQAMGWVSLPFTATADARAAPSRGRGWRAAFTEKFLPPYSPRHVARWALRHAQEAAPELADSPVRKILPDIRKPNAEAEPETGPEPEPVTLWLPTAAIVDGQAQSRLLLAPGAPLQLLGRRLWSRPRLAAVAFVALAAVALPSGVGWVSALRWDDAPVAQDLPPQPADVLAMANEAAAAPGGDSAPAGEPVGHEGWLPQDDAPGEPPGAHEPLESLELREAEPAGAPRHSEPEPEAEAEAEAEPTAARGPRAGTAAAPAAASAAQPALPLPLAGLPLDMPARRGLVLLPQRGLALDEAAKAAAREASGAARTAHAAAHVTTAPVAYAVAAPRVRSQAEGELMRSALQAAVARAAPVPGCRVEALPAGEDWRVVCWPFLHRADAVRLREQLVARGHRLEVIDF